METKKERPKYNLWQNSAYMIALAWRKRKSVLFLCLAVAAVATLTSVVQIYIAPVILRRVETTAPIGELITTILVFTGALLVLSALNAYLEQNTLFGRIEVRTNLVWRIHEKFCTVSYPLTEDPKVLKMVERAQTAVSGNNQATEAIWNTFTDLLKNAAGFIIYLFLLSSLDTVLLLVVIATAALSYFVTKRIHEWEYRHMDEAEEYDKKIQYVEGKARDVSLAKDIRIFGMRPWLDDMYRSTLKLYEDFAGRRERTYFWADVIDAALTLLRNGIAYFYLISITINDGLPASQFLLYFTAVSGFTAWITGILAGFSTLHRQSVDLSVLREYLELPDAFKFEDGEPLKPDHSQGYEIELKGVSFRYPGAEEDTIRGLNLTVRPGEKLAVVGLNGAGKTTLVKLICGFYDPTEGEVLLNGRDIRTYNRRDYYGLFSAVFQNFSVLEITLEENVAQTDVVIDENKVAACIEKAGLAEKVASLPDGIKTHIGREVFEDGVELSGGEMQRLMLARALYKDAPVLVLDEPTAALDPIAENDIYLKYNEMTAGRTSVFISHRLASTRFCDRIIFIADGGIAEEGTHEALMEQGGKYAELFHVQSKYYEEGSEF